MSEGEDARHGGGRSLLGRPGTATWLRMALLVLPLALALMDGSALAVLPWLLPLGLLGLVADRVMERGRTPAMLVTVADVAVLWSGVVATGGAESPLLPFVVATLGTAGRTLGNRGAAAATAVSALLATVVCRAVPGSDPESTVAVAQWLALGLGAGIVAAWSERLHRLGASDENGYTQVRRHLTELRALASRLPGGLEPASAAEVLLQRCDALARHEKAVVLVRENGGALVPLAVRGMDHLPWRNPVTDPGTLHTAWSTKRTVLDVRPPDPPGGRRAGSSLLVVPLSAADGNLLGLAVFESRRLYAFTAETVRAVEQEVRHHAPRVESAVLFSDLRHSATTEERERLARQMHDGVAQDLAYVGFALDNLRHRLTAGSPDQAGRVSDLRNELTQMIQDIRLSITDLRSTVGPARGLGSALSAYVRTSGAGTGMRVHLTLSESPMRLPTDRETQLFRLVQAFIAQARGAQAANLWVGLETNPPSATLSLEHDGQDGAGAGGRKGLWESAVAAVRDQGAEVAMSDPAMSDPAPDRFRVVVRLRGGTRWRSESSSSTTTH